jgi:polyisoprenoid-binding protein YceI
MNKPILNLAIGSCFLLAFAAYAAEQMQVFPTKPGGNQKIRIEGTSTVHDWQMESPAIGGVFEVESGFPTEPGQEVKPGPVQAKVEASIPVRSLKSLEKDGKPYSDSMNGIVWKNLKMEQYPKIVYRLNSLTLKESPKSKDGAYVFDSQGDLAVAGVTNKISMPVNVTPMGNKTLRITGNTKVKMTSFGIQPPSPVGLGLLIKTGDEVKLMFDWTVAQRAAGAGSAAK